MLRLEGVVDLGGGGRSSGLYVGRPEVGVRLPLDRSPWGGVGPRWPCLDRDDLD